jgi:hypothetical protein
MTSVLRSTTIQLLLLLSVLLLLQTTIITALPPIIPGSEKIIYVNPNVLPFLSSSLDFNVFQQQCFAARPARCSDDTQSLLPYYTLAHPAVPPLLRTAFSRASWSDDGPIYWKRFNITGSDQYGDYIHISDNFTQLYYYGPSNVAPSTDPDITLWVMDGQCFDYTYGMMSAPISYGFKNYGLAWQTGGPVTSCGSPPPPVPMNMLSLCACKSKRPNVVSAITTSAGTIRITFDQITNRGGNLGYPRPCLELCKTVKKLITIPTVLNWENTKCQWIRGDTLELRFPPNSNFFPTQHGVDFHQANIYDRKSDASYALNGSHFIQPIGSPIAFSVANETAALRLIAPKTFSKCDPALHIRVEANFGAGRPFDPSIASVQVSPGLQNGYVATFNSQAMRIDIPSTNFLPLTTYTVTLNLTNWMGQSAQASTPVLVSGSLLPLALPPGPSNFYISTFIVGSHLTVRKVRAIDFNTRFIGEVRFAPECLPNVGFDNMYLSWNWTIHGPLNDTSQPYTSVPQIRSYSFPRPLLNLPGFSLSTPNNLPTLYAVRLVTRVAGVKDIPIATEFGSDIQIIRVDPAPMVVVFKPIPGAIVNESSIILDASGSCDPNRVGAVCNILQGLPPGDITTNPLVAVKWEWFTFDDQFIGNATGIKPASPLFWYKVGLFKIRITVSPLQGDVLKLSRVVNVMLSVLPKPIIAGGGPPPPICAPPEIKLPVFQGNPPQINLQNSPLFVKPVIIGGPPDLSWSWKIRQFDSITLTDNDFVPIPDNIAVFTDRPVIAFSPLGLQQGQTYTFRLSTSFLCPGAGSPISASADMTFLVNNPPFSGMLTVSPPVGVEYKDTFILVASAFTDANDVGEPDLPFMYQFSYQRPGTFVSVALGEWQYSSSLQTVLSSGRRLKASTSGTVYVQCRDVLNGVSKPVIAPVQVLSLFDPQNLNVDQQTNLLPDPDEAVRSVFRRGGTMEEALLVLSALSNAASTLGEMARNASLTPIQITAIAVWRKHVASVTINLVFTSRDAFSPDETMDQIALQFATLSAALQGSASNLGPGDLYRVTTLMELLLKDANAVVLKNINDPQTGITITGLVNSGMAASYLEILAGLALGVANAKASGDLLPGLADAGVPANWANLALTRLKTMIRLLVNVLMQGYEPGAPPTAIKSEFIEISLSREFREKVGAPHANGALELDNDDGKGAAGCVLPPGALNSTLRPRNETQFGKIPDTIDMAIIHYRFNFLELLSNKSSSSNFTLADRKPGGKDPRFSVTEVVSVIFLNQNNPDDVLDPTGLTTTINITVPLPDGYQLPTDNLTEPACGAFDDEVSDWSVSGCTALEVNLEEQFMICGCTHASDFSAWNAFLADAAATINVTPATLTRNAVLVIGVLLPCLLLLWLLFLFWASRQDEVDGGKIEIGAIMLLTKNKLRLWSMQRRFFRLLRENAQKPQPLQLQDEMLRNQELVVLKQQRDLAESVEKKKPACWRRLPVIIRGWLEGLMLDHGVFGTVARFDPFYTRTQRVTVVMAVIAGNLFASSLLFELKTAKDVSLSAGVYVAVVFGASVIVAVPVKIVVRLLFRATEPLTGSLMHRVAQIYRITEVHHDLLPGFATSAEQKDIEMILAFKRVALSETDLDVALRLRARLANPDDHSSSSGGGGCCAKLRSRTDQQTLMERRLTIASMNPEMLKRLGLLHSTDHPVGLDEAEAAVRQARVNVSQHKRLLKKACEESRREWNLVPRHVNARVDTLRKQQSMAFRLAALVYDEAGTRPRERAKLFSHYGCVIFGWVFVFAYFVFCLTWCALWVMNRSVHSEDYLRAEMSNSTTTSSATFTNGTFVDEVTDDSNYVISAWLVAGFSGAAIGLFVVEPLLQFLRFGVMAWCLKRFGNGTSQSGKIVTPEMVEKDPSLALVTKAQVLDSFNRKTGDKETTAQFWLLTAMDAAADVIDALA